MAQNQPSSQQPQSQQRRTPILLKSLLGKVHAVAHEIGDPETYGGIVFYTADKSKHGRRPNSYHIRLNNATELTNSQIERIVAIVNEERPEDQQFVARTIRPPRRQRNQQKQQSSQPEPAVKSSPPSTQPVENTKPAVTTWAPSK